MKVLHLLKTSIGASWGLRQMRELVNLGVDVHVALPDGPMVEKYQDVGVKTHILQTGIHVGKPWKNFSLFKAFRKLVKEVEPDIIHSHFVATTMTMRLALGKNHPIKRIFHVPGPLHLEHWVYRTAEIIMAGKSDYWLGSCRWTVDAYKRFGIEASRIGLVYYGVDLDQHPIIRKGKLRKQLGLSDDCQVVGNVAYFYAPKPFLGQVRGLKGHEDMIDAIDIVSKNNSDVVGVFVGGPWDNAHEYMEKVVSYAEAKEYGKYYFLGYRSDVQDLYGDFTLAVHPSHSENVGGAVESLLCQVPTIATNIGGFPDLVVHDKTGWLVPSKNPKALAERLVLALDNEEQRLNTAKAGRALAAELFDVRNNARDINIYYKRLLETGCLGELDD